MFLSRYKAMAIRLPKALTRKRNELAYELAQAATSQARLREELRAVDYTLKLLDPQWRPPRKPHKPAARRVLEHGQIARTCLEILRVMPGISTPELADQVAEECEVTFKTPVAREDFASSVAMALRRYQRKGLLEVVGEHPRTGALKWRYADDGDEPHAPRRLCS
jgi:hypothetical protein